MTTLTEQQQLARRMEKAKRRIAAEYQPPEGQESEEDRLDRLTRVGHESAPAAGGE